jgi:hypothetical protein
MVGNTIGTEVILAINLYCYRLARLTVKYHKIQAFLAASGDLIEDFQPAIGVFVIIFSGLVWLLLKVSNGLRVDLEGEINGLEDFMYRLKQRQTQNIRWFEFHNTDIQREDVVREVLDIYSS